MSEAEEKKVSLEENEGGMKQTLQKIMEEKKSRETKYKEQNKKFDGLHKRKEELKESFDRANTRDVTIQADMTETNKRRKKVIELLKEENNKIEDLEKVPERNNTKIAEFGEREKKLAAEKENLEVEKSELLVSLRAETLVLQEKKEKIQTKLVDERKTVDEAKSAFSIAESELKLFISTEENERQKLETLKQSLEENKDKLTERSRELKEVKQKLPAVEKSYKDALANLDRVKIEEAKIINEIKVQRVQLEETRSAQQASKSRGRVLESLTQQKNEGNLPGLFGRLGDLGAIDQKYDVAVSTACGPLDNIVVDTVDTAQWCIEFLKQHNIGRATFIALDKQEHLRQYYSTAFKAPENVPRLFDLIKVEDDRVRPAFYYALRDTLVATEIDQATRIAYGARRFRVVTLKGDLIETSGTMSGGGKTVFKGRMGQSVTVQSKGTSPRKVQDMEGALARLEQQAKNLHEKQTVLEKQCSTLQVEVRQLKTNLEMFTIEVQSLQQQQPNLMTQLKKQEQKVKESCANPAQVKKLEKMVEEKKIEFDKANAKSVELQREVDTINKEIKDKTDKKMRGVNKKLSECTDTLEKCKAEIVKLTVAIKTAERNMKKSKDKIENLEHERVEAENKLRAWSAERKEIEVDAAKLLEIMEKIAEEISEEEEEFAEEREAIEELTKQVNKLKAEKIEVDQRLNEIKKSIKENNYALTGLKTKLSALTLQEIPEHVNEPLREFTDHELENTDTKHMEIELKREEEELKSARPNLTAINEYRKKEMHYLDRVKEVEEVTSKRMQMKELREELRKKRQKEFHAGFNLISQKLKEMYQLITLGGDAELEMVDSYDPFAEGVILNVRPPKKSWKNITNLSGGEKTLSSLALVFALHYYKPSPLYFMDEIDAALDFKNVSIVGNYIKERTKNAQFIIISLRSNMFELADHLIGIYKTYNITKSLTINPGQYNKKQQPSSNGIAASQVVPSTRPTQINGVEDVTSLYDYSASEHPDSQDLFSTQNTNTQEGMEVA